MNITNDNDAKTGNFFIITFLQKSGYLRQVSVSFQNFESFFYVCMLI